MDDTPKPATLKAVLIYGVMGISSAAAGYISTHWGGVTTEQLKAVENRIGEKVDNVKWDVAKGGDLMKKYVDETVSASEARILAAQPKKRKVPRE